jgi:nitric oxide reductase subunit B
MFGMGLAFGVAGVLQSYLERVLGIGYMPAQEHMGLWMAIVFWLGIVFLAGAALTVYDLLKMKPRAAEA